MEPAVRADFRRLYPANAKMSTCCPSDDNRTKVTNSVTSARSLWWHVGPYFWPADLTRTANPTMLALNASRGLLSASSEMSKGGRIVLEHISMQSQGKCTNRSQFEVRWYRFHRNVYRNYVVYKYTC